MNKFIQGKAHRRRRFFFLRYLRFQHCLNFDAHKMHITEPITSFRFRKSLDDKSISAKVNHGLLEIRLPKRSARKIPAFDKVGQNIYLQKISKRVPGLKVKKAVKKWFGEVQDFDENQICLDQL